jgi:5'-3' exonuclease
VKVHLVDGTYELFRAFFGAPRAASAAGTEVGATRGLLNTLLSLIRQNDVSHIACAFDTVIESFRNQLYSGYKTGEGVPPDLLAQFGLAERATRGLGIVVWSMIDYEADDALATAAARWKEFPGVEQIVICSPDKDLAQCVVGKRVITWDRRRAIQRGEQEVIARFGVAPQSIPDWLALVGDSADGFPGVVGWGKKTSALVLYRYRHLDAIPRDPTQWDIDVRGADRLAAGLERQWDDALLYRDLARLRTDVPLEESLDDLEWQGARRKELEGLCREIGFEEFLERVPRYGESD